MFAQLNEQGLRIHAASSAEPPCAWMPSASRQRIRFVQIVSMANCRGNCGPEGVPSSQKWSLADFVKMHAQLDMSQTSLRGLRPIDVWTLWLENPIVLQAPHADVLVPHILCELVCLTSQLRPYRVHMKLQIALSSTCHAWHRSI